jgi:hypothetical protein
VPDPFELPELPPSPAGALQMTVACRTSRTPTGGRSHPVRIETDWSVCTPHDIDLERIAIAMGGYLSCVALVDGTAPTLRELVQRQARRRAPHIRRNLDGRWLLSDTPLACRCDRSGFADAAEAADHWRSLQHVCAERGVGHRDLERLASAVYQAWDTEFVQPPREPARA